VLIALSFTFPEISALMNTVKSAAKNAAKMS
jgi:hypothetical protein